jgi:S-formylglutathione hydrolase FrmB
MMFVIDPQDRFWWDGNVRLHEKLAALGIPHQYDVTTSAGGHSWEYFDYMAPRVVEFIVKGLQSELQRKIGLEY